MSEAITNRPSAASDAPGPDAPRGPWRTAGRRLLPAAVAAAVLVGVGAGSASAADTLPGSGTAAAPYLIGSDADLDTALQMINADTAHTGASAADYKVVADLDYSQDPSNTTGAATARWSGIDWFNGTFDGDGHTISNLTYAIDGLTTTYPASTAPAGQDLGFFRVLDRATVKNLTLQNVQAASQVSNTSVGGVSVWSFASTVNGVEIAGSKIGPSTGGGASWVGGLVALAYANEFADGTLSVTDGLSSTFTNNRVFGSTVSDANRTGGLVGMATGPTTVSDNYVNAALSNPSHPVAGAGGGTNANGYYYVIGGLVGEVGPTYRDASGAQADGVSMTDNVIGGTIRGSASDHRSIQDVNFASATVGYATTATYTGASPAPAAGNWSTSNNLVSSDIQYPNETGSGLPGTDGTSVSPQTLATEATYTGTATGQTDASTTSAYDQLGWSSAVGAVRPWTWTGDPASGTPALEASAGLAVVNTTIDVPVGSAPSDATLLSDAGATTTSGTATIDTSNVTWSTPGSYEATIGATGGYANPVAVTVVVFTPGTVIVAHPTVTFPQTSSAPSEGEVLDALGAALPTGAAGTPTVDLTGALSGDDAVQWNKIGSYTVTVSDTSSTDGLTPTRATIDIAKAGVTTVELDDSAPVYQATSSAPSASEVLLAMGAAIVNGDGQPTIDLTGAVAGDDAVRFDTPGLYHVTVSDTAAADDAAPVTVVIKVVAVSVVTADTTVYFNTSTPPTNASILSAAGAKITDGAGNTVSGTLTVTVGSDCGMTVGTCTATINGTDMYGFATAPATVEVDVSAAVVSVAHDTATFTATGSAPSQAALVSALGATVSGSALGGTPAVDTSNVDWSVPGTYAVTVGDGEAHDAADTVAASIHVVPVPYVTVPDATVYLPMSGANPLAATTLLANASATITDVYGNTVHGTLSADTSAVNASVAGTYSATITGTDDFGNASSPVTVTVVVYLSAQQPGTVSISGTAAVGATLTATPAGWAALADPSYQWLRGGVEIPGATGSTYTVTAADAGQTLAVRMTESPEWYSTASATSAAVTVPAPVTSATPPATATKAPTKTAAPKVSSTSYRSGSVRLKLKVAAKGTVTIKVTAKSGKKTITLGTRKLSVKKPGTVSTTVGLSKAAKSLIKRGLVRSTVTITLKPSAKGAKAVSSHKALTIKKAAK
ncbi:MAG TPA: hypothetical protein VGM91_02490 [Conexibacter sp.]|jgi:hypothetical protein